MGWELGGLPLHPLFVHFTAVTVPVAALLGLLGAVSSRARRRIGAVAPVVSLAALVSTPLASSSGEWLQENVSNTALVKRHAQLADFLLPCVVALFVFSAALWAWDRFGRHLTSRRHISPGLVAAAQVALPVLLALASLVSLVAVVLIGHSGSVAVWQG